MNGQLVAVLHKKFFFGGEGGGEGRETFSYVNTCTGFQLC